ncbi:MAG: response regulator transcription factor [Myxococcota bacterium]
MRLLLAEDTPALARSLATGLREEGYTVDVVGDGESALHLATELEFDLIVLDRMMPKLDGVAVLQALRRQGVRTPVLLLTALGEVQHRVDGLNAGADDYLVKPFAFEELVARLRALVRREFGQAQDAVTIGPLVLDLAARTATVNGQPLELTARELAVLELFVMKPGVTWSRTKLAEHLYDEDTERDSNVIDVFIARLRKKLDAAGLPGSALITTQRGLGYRFEPSAVKP